MYELFLALWFLVGYVCMVFIYHNEKEGVVNLYDLFTHCFAFVIFTLMGGITLLALVVYYIVEFNQE